MKNNFSVILLFLMLVLGIGLFVLPQEDFSELENRNLNTNNSIKIDTFITDTDSVMKDQFYFRNIFTKKFYEIKTAFKLLINRGDDYIFLNDEVVDIGDGYLVNSYSLYQEGEIASAENRGFNVNEVDLKYPGIKTYVYFPTRFEEIMYIPDLENYLDDMKESFICQLNKNISYQSLNYASLDEYKQYFFKSDFHWNIDGAYQGYSDIVNMINDDFSIGNPKAISEEKTFGYDFIGNVASKIGKITEADKIRDYILSDVGDFDYYEDGELKDYFKNKNAYSENGTDGAASDYDTYFGPYSLERVFDFHDDSKPTILIFGDSFVNPIQEWLASHFNKTIIIDLRSKDEDFSLDEIINEYDVDAILVCQMYYNLYINGNMFIPLN